MDVREATTEDIDGIRRVARKSLVASYGHALETDLIDEAVEHWYGAADLTEDLTDEDALFVVAVEGGDVVGFAQAYVLEGREALGEIDWLHVSPDHRGKGLGSQLLARVETRLRERGVDRIEGRVLAANEAGTEFYGDHGFDLAGETTVEIGGETFEELIYTAAPERGEGQVVLERRAGPDDRVIYVAYDESERASKAPFYAAYLDADREERYGWFCGNCESVAAAMDTMGRVECTACGNRRKPTRWDAAYL